MQFNRRPVLAALLVGYFGFLTIADYLTLRQNHPHLLQVIFYSDTVIILLRFLGGCTLAIAWQFSAGANAIADLQAARHASALRVMPTPAADWKSWHLLVRCGCSPPFAGKRCGRSFCYAR